MLDTFVAIGLGNAFVATLFALGVVLLSRWCHKPALLHGLWVVVLLKLVTPPMITIPIPVPISEFVPETALVEQTVPDFHTYPQSTTPPNTKPDGPIRQTSSPSVFNPTIEIDAPSNPAEETATPLPDVLTKEDFLPPSDSMQTEEIVSRDFAGTVANADSSLKTPSPERSTDFPAVTPGGTETVLVPQPVSRLNWQNGIWCLIAAWAAGAIVALFISCRQIWCFERSLRLATPAKDDLLRKVEQLARRVGLPRSPAVYLLPGTVSPMLWGFGWRPRLLLPAKLLDRLNEEATETLILHELAHLRRGDHWVRMLEIVCLCIYWWHPVIWWGRKQLRIVEEECCDAFVVEHCQGGVYARALLATVDFLSNHPATVPPAASGIGQLEFLKRRLTMIMQGGVSARLAGLPKFLLLVAAVIGLSILPRVVAETAQADSKAAEPETTKAEAEETRDDFQSDSTKPTESSGSDALLLIGQEPIEFEKTPRGYPTPQLEVRDLEFSPDGKLLAAGYGRWDTAGEIVVYDFAQRKVLQKFPTAKGVATVTFSPDGKYLAASYWNTQVEIRETETWKLIAEKTTGSKITRLDFSPDGKYLAAASEAGLLTMWTVGAWDKERPFEGELFRFQKVIFSPDSKLLVAVGGSFNQPRFGRGLVFEVESGKQIAKFESNGSVFAGVAFSPDGKELATGVFGQGVYFYEARTGKSIATVNLPGTVRDLEYDQNGRLVAACGDNLAYLIKDHNIQRQLGGHEDEVLSATFSPDSKILVTGSEDSLIRIWNSETGVPLDTLRPHEAWEDTQEAVLAIAHSPNGQYVVTTHEDGSVRLRKAESGQLVRLLEGHQDIVSTVAFSPDSRRLATGSYDHLVKLWDVATGESIRDLKGHSNWVFSVRFSPDGKTLASAAYDKTIQLWDVAEGKPIGVLEGHSAAVRSVAFSPDGQKLVSGSSDRTVRVWDLNTRKILQELKGHMAAIRTVDYAPDGSQIASGSEDKTIRFWNPNTGELMKELKGHQGMVWALAFSPRGRTLASGGFDNKLIIWNASTGTSLQTLNAHQDVLTSLSYAPDTSFLVTGSYDKTLKLWPAIEPPIPALADLNLNDGSGAPAARFVLFTPDGKRMITGNQNRQIRLWDLETGRVIKQVIQDRGVSFGALDADGKLLATSGYGGACYLFDVESLKLRKTFDKESGENTTVALSPNGQVLVSGARDGSLTIWDTDSGAKIQELPRLELPIEGLAFSPDGKLLASTSGDYKQHTKPGTVKLWNTETWDEVANLPGPTQKMRAIQFSPDGKTLIAGGSQSELLVYNVAAKTLSKRISFPTEVSTCAFLPSSRFAVLGGWDGRVELWDLQSGTRSVRYDGHRPANRDHNFIFHVAASVDGSVVASAGGDGHVKLWPATNLAPIKPLMTLENPDTEVFHVAMSPDGSQFVISKADKTLQIIETKTGKILKTIENLNTPCAGLAFAPDGKTFAGGMLGGKVFIWDAETGEELRTLEGHPGGTRRVAFSPDGQWLASGGWDETAAVWNTTDGTLRYRTAKQGLSVSDVKFSPEGKLLLASTGSWKDFRQPGKLKAWMAEDGKYVKTIGDHQAELKGFTFDAGGWHLLPYGVDGAKIGIRFTNQFGGTVGQEHTLTAAIASPDGNTLYAGTAKGNVLAYDLQTHQLKRTFAGHDQIVHGMAASQDGSILVTSSKDGSVKIWAAEQIPVLARTFELRDDPKETLAVAYSPDGKWIAVGGKDKTVSILDAKTKEILREISGHNGMIFRMVFTPDSKSLLTSSSDGTVRLWDISDSRQLASFKVHGDQLEMVRSLAVSPNGKRLAAGNWAGQTYVWDLETREKQFQLPQQELPVSGVAFSPDGELLATCTGSWREDKKPGTAKLWNAQTGELVADLPGHKSEIKGLLFTDQGKTLVTWETFKIVRFWDVESKSLRKKFAHDRTVTSVAELNTELALGDFRGGISLLDRDRLKIQARTGGHFDQIGNIAVSPDGSELATASHDGYFKTWATRVAELALRQLPSNRDNEARPLAEQIRDWQPLATADTSALQLKKGKVLNPHGNQIWFAIYSPDGKTLATGGSDKTVKLWNAETLELLQTLSGHGSFTTHAAFSPDGKNVATVSWRSNGNLKLWDVQTGKLLATSDVHKETCRQVAFSPDGQFIATVSEDHFVRVFNPQLAMLLSMDAGLNAYSLDFSPDSQILAVGTGNLGEKKEGHILLYDTQTGEKKKDLDNSNGYVFHLQFLKDGKRLLAANGGAGCGIWNTETGEMEELYRAVEDTRWVEIDRDEERLIASARVGEVFLWNRYVSAPVVSLKASEKFIHCATFSPDGRHIVVADEAGALTLWEITDTQQSQVAKPNTSAEE